MCSFSHKENRFEKHERKLRPFRRKNKTKTTGIETKIFVRRTKFLGQGYVDTLEANENKI